MQLRVCKNKQHPVEVAAQDLPPLTMNPSDLVVESIQIEPAAPIIAGDMLPALR